MELKQVYVTDALGKRLMVRMLDSQSGELKPISVDTYNVPPKPVTPITDFETHIENNLCYLDTYIGTNPNVVVPAEDEEGRKTILKQHTFIDNTIVETVDLNYVPWVNNNMLEGFSWCTHLTSVTNINENVTDMDNTFTECSNLVNVPVIPNSVTSMYGTFIVCYNLTGDIYIYSDKIEYADYCFNGTSLNKDVYIPLYTQSGSETLTFQSFKSEGYSTTTRKHGVILKDINNL